MENDIENSDWKREVPYIAGLSFKVPPGYFDNLSERIQAHVLVDDLKEQVGSGGFTVPEEYFENLTERITARTREKAPAGLFRLAQGHIFKYAAAACLVLTCGILWYVNEPAPVSKKLAFTGAETEQLLFDIDEEVIIEHIQDHQQGEITTEVSKQELETYILNNFSHSDLSSE